MAKRNQEIKIVVHMPADAKEIFNSSQIREFWIEKILNKIQACSSAGVDQEILMDNLSI